MLKDADYWSEKYRTNTAEYVNRYFALAMFHRRSTIVDCDTLEPEVDNLVKVMERLSEWEDWVSVCFLMWALENFLSIRGYWDALRICFDHAIHAARMLGNARDEAAFSINLAALLMQTGDMIEAKQVYLRVLPIFEQLGKKRDMAVAYQNLGILASIAREYAEARSYLEQSLAIKEVNDEKGIANSLHELGNVAIQEKDYPAAHKYYEQSLAMGEKLDNQMGIASTFENLAVLAEKEDKLEEAEQLHKQAIEIFEAFGNVLDIAIVKHNLAGLYMNQGRLEEALTLLEDAVEKAEHLGYYKAPGWREELVELRQKLRQKKQAKQGIIPKLVKFLWRR